MAILSHTASEKFFFNGKNQKKKGDQKIRFSNFEKFLYLDVFISPDYFLSSFVDAFGWFTYYFTQIGAFYGGILFFELLLKSILAALRTLEIHKMAGNTVSFGKIVLAATTNLFLASILNGNKDAKPSAPPAADLVPITANKKVLLSDAENNLYIKQDISGLKTSRDVQESVHDNPPLIH